jgi:acyl-CoA thioester hydrolase
MAEFRAVDLPFRVRYAETDQMGVAYYANYLVWFEMGRSEYCRAIGYPYTRIEEEGFVMVVAEATVRYRSPARYDDELIVRTTMTEVRSRVCSFGYQVIRKESGELLAEGETTHVVVDAESGKPTRMPPHYIEVFEEGRKP